MQFDCADANHGKREFCEALDDYSTTFALLNDDDEIIATLRCTLLAKLPDPRPLIEKFSMQPFMDRFSLSSLATTSRFMFRGDQRKSTNVLRLLQASVAFGLNEGIRFNFGDTNPIWLDILST